MTDSIRLKRLQKLALRVASQVVLHELNDPRLELVTLTRVNLTSDLTHGTIYWSTLGNDAHRNKVAHALATAAGPVQRAIARNFETRRSPRIRFEFDESIAGAIRVGGIIDELSAERAEREAAAATDCAEVDDDRAPDASDDASGDVQDDAAPGDARGE